MNWPVFWIGVALLVVVGHRGQGHAGDGDGCAIGMSVLDEIIAGVRIDLARRQAAVSLDDLKETAARQDSALDPMPAYRADGVSVIAEVKRSSPSRATLAAITDPAALASDYAVRRRRHDQRAHRGAPLRRQPRRPARRARGVNVPVLRKDFIVTSYQLWEARACGADLALLIVAALSTRPSSRA